MDLSSYTRTAPAISITQADGAMILSKSTAAEGGVYYTGKLTATSAVGVSKPTNDFGMSDFSSWGVPAAWSSSLKSPRPAATSILSTARTLKRAQRSAARTHTKICPVRPWPHRRSPVWLR